MSSLPDMYVRLRGDLDLGIKLRVYSYRDVRYRWEDGWHLVDGETAADLATVRQDPRDPESPRAFDVVATLEEGQALDRSRWSGQVVTLARKRCAHCGGPLVSNDRSEEDGCVRCELRSRGHHGVVDALIEGEERAANMIAQFLVDIAYEYGVVNMMEANDALVEAACAITNDQERWRRFKPVVPGEVRTIEIEVGG